MKVNSAQAGPEPTKHVATKRSKPTGDPEQSINERLLAEIQEIKSYLNKLKGQVRNSQPAGAYRKPPRFNRPRGRQSTPLGCKECKSKRTADWLLAATVLTVVNMDMSGGLAQIRKTRVGYFSGTRGNRQPEVPTYMYFLWTSTG